MENEEYATRIGPLAQRLATLLKEREWFMATAESCTGGMVAAALTSLAGSSAWFKGSIVAYANDVKKALLDVPEAILREHGAVSQDTVRSMARGVCRRVGVQAGVSISGIAGPSGGTREKPVGTVCIGTFVEGGVMAQTFYFGGDREAVRLQSVVMALDMLANHVTHGI